MEYAAHYARASDLGASLASWVRVDGSKYYSLGLRFGVVGFPSLFFLGAVEAEGGERREVRRLALTSQSHEGVLEYARGGYRLQYKEPQDLLQGPWGALALGKFHAMRAYEVLYFALQTPAAAFGVPDVIVQFALVFLLLCALTSAIIHCAVCAGASRRLARKKAYLRAGE